MALKPQPAGLDVTVVLVVVVVVVAVVIVAVVVDGSAFIPPTNTHPTPAYLVHEDATAILCP